MERISKLNISLKNLSIHTMLWFKYMCINYITHESMANTVTKQYFFYLILKHTLFKY